MVLLLMNGADPKGGAEGIGRQETSLHWAASSDDVDVAEALIDVVADIEAPGGSIAAGVPLDNAVGMRAGEWHACSSSETPAWTSSGTQRR